MVISELLTQKTSYEITTIDPDSSLLEMSVILAEQNIGFLVALDDSGGIFGVVSERDLSRALVRFPEGLATRRVREIMTKKVISCDLNDTVLDVLDTMNTHGIRHIPVLEHGKPKAVLSLREFNLAYQRLQHQVRTDYMTDLANRRHFMEVLAQELNRRHRFGASLSIIMIDIDHFKRINDVHGHCVGDQVICGLSDLLKKQCRIYDVVGRMGGEEFAILCPNTNLAGGEVICERLINAIRQQRVQTEAGNIEFTASFGLYETTRLGEEVETIIRNVDGLLYQAKREGRDRVIAGDSVSCANVAWGEAMGQVDSSAA